MTRKLTPRRSWSAPGLLALAAVIGILAANGLSQEQLATGITLLAYVAVASAWNILGGYAGQISLGTAAFVGFGGYAGGSLMIHAGLGWELAIVAAGVLSAGFSALLALPLLRLRGIYFAVGTLAAGVVLAQVADNWGAFGGVNGELLPASTPIGLPLFQAAVVVCAVTLAAALYVRNSRFGLRLAAVRDDEAAAEGLGVATFRHRLVALVLSGALTGMAGAIIAMNNLGFSPDLSFNVSWSLYAVLMTVVGGAGTFTGPILGSVLIYYGLTQQLQSHAELALIIQGAVLIAVVRFAPAGLWPFLVQLTRRVSARVVGPGRRPTHPVTDTDPTQPEPGVSDHAVVTHSA